MTSLTSGRFQPPLSLTEGNTVDFVFRLSNNGTLFTPPLTPVWIFGIKDANTPNGDFLIQVNSATSASGVYTFVVELASAELQAWLATATSQSYAAIQITDSANDIATAPLLCQIAPNQNDTGTTPSSANGTLNVTAGKTVTFPQSLTFPSALGTNGFQLSTDGAGTLTWTASGGVTDGDKGDITVTNNGGTWTIDNDVVGLAQLAHMPTARVVGRTTSGNGSPELLTISGTGSVAMTNTPTLVTPVLGAATATSINGITISAGGSGTLTMAGSISTGSSGGSISTNTNGGSIDTGNQGGNINTCCNGGDIDTSEVGGSISTTGDASNGLYPGGSINTAGGVTSLGGDINTSGSGANAGGNINTSGGGGSITTNGNGSIGLGIVANRTYLVSTAGNNEKTATFPNVTGTVAVAATSATDTQALFATATAGAPAYRAIATADIATALTTPGAIGGTTASTGAFTTVSLKGATSGVVTLAAPATATTATLTFAPSASVTMTPPATSFTAARTDAAQTFSGSNIFQGLIANEDANGLISFLTIKNSAGTTRGKIGYRDNFIGGIQFTGDGNASMNFGGDTVFLFAGGSVYLTMTTSGSAFTGAVTCSTTLAVAGATTLGGGTAIAKLRHGSATLVAGTKTVTDTAITANSRIWINRFTDGGTLGDSYSITRSAGASFTITSKTANVTATLDTSVVSYLIIEP